MMTTPATAAPLQVPSPAPEGHAAVRPAAAHPFAELLRQNRAPVAAVAAPAPPGPAADASDAPRPADAGKPQEGQKAKARVAGQAPQRPARGEAKDKVEATPPSAAKPAERSASGDTATDPALAQFLADLHLPPVAKTDANAAPADASTGVDGDPTGRGASGQAADARTAAAESRQHVADKDETTRAFDAAGLADQQRLAAAEAATPRERQAGEGGTHRAELLPNATALGGAPLLSATTAPAAAQAPVSVALATPLNAPDFAQALGAQVSVLAKDGVQRAQLHLNPAEMGPVSVQIVLDGTQARIDFGSDVAATRHAIEAGLPELASALRDAGLTLSGGGVSQHSRGRSDSDGAHGGRKGGTDPARSTEPLRPLQRLAVPGGVDLYA